MTDMVRAMNPTASITDAAEARAAARASAVAIFIGVAWGIIGLIWLIGPGAEAMEAAMAEAAAAAPEAAAMTEIMSGAAVGVAAVVIVVQSILGLVQWFKPNVVIPILFTVLVVYGLGTGVMGLMKSEVATGPAWLTYGALVVAVVQLVLHISGIRGASALNKFRDAPAD